MTTQNGESSKPYDLEERTFQFARASRTFVKLLPRTITNIEDVKQFVRASGPIGANYIEANEAIGKKDFVMKIKICRREAKESRYWLRLIDADGKLEPEQRRLLGGNRGIDENLWRNRPQVEGIGILNSSLGIVSDFDIRYSSF
jgi:four helix bundle protein